MTIKRAIAIGTLSAITITLIAFGIKTKSFKPKTTTPFAQHRSAIRVDAETTTLQNTKWILKKTPNLTNQIIYNINFISNNFTSVMFEIDNGSLIYTNDESEDMYAYHNNNWINGITYRNIEITGGNDASNTNLIQWFLDNATQVQVTNLANTTWTFNQFITTWVIDNYALNTVHINFISNDNESNYVGMQAEPSYDYWGEDIEYWYIAYMTSPSDAVEVYKDTTYWEDSAYRQIHIIDGNDIELPQLILFLTLNATLNNSPSPTPTPTPDQTIEVIPIMPMMFKILTMPFTFISQAFNVTLWEGTPYEFNFSNFILSLIAIATLLFIIKLFTSGFSIIGNYSANHESRALKRSQTKLNNAKTEQIKSGNKTKQSKKG